MEEDVLLVRQTLAGDEKAYHRLMQKYQKPIYAQILSMVQNPADAEELTNDVFIKAYQNLSSLRQPDRFFFWTVRIAMNHGQNWLQRHKKPFLSLEAIFDEIEGRLAYDSVEYRLLQQERIDKTFEAIETLPEIDKVLMHEFYLEGASYETLQKRYHLSKDAIRMRLFKARRKVREKVLKMLKGIVAFPWRDFMEKLFIGGIEAVKISATTKLVTVWTATLLIVGGITVSVWHSKPSKQVMPKVATQSVQEMPQKSFGPSFSKQKPSVTPVEKPTVSPPVTGSVETEEPMDDADWEALLAELGGNEQTVAPVTNEKGTSEKKSDDSSKSEQWEAEVEEVKMQIMQTISERAHAFRELERLGKIPNPDPALVSKYMLGRRLIGYEVMQNVAKYIRLTGDMAAIEPGGWIYEYGHATGGFLFLKADPEAARFGDKVIQRMQNERR